MKQVPLKNVYGYPALSDRIRKYAEVHNATIVISMYNVDPADESMKIVVAGLPFLCSTKIPIIGYRMYDNGAWYRSDLPPKLKPNEIIMSLPKFHAHPTNEELFNLFVNKQVSENMSSRFASYHKLQCLNERVFKVEPKAEAMTVKDSPKPKTAVVAKKAKTK